MELARPNTSTTVRAENRGPVPPPTLRYGMQLLARVAPRRAAAVAERLFLTPQRRRRPASESEALASARRFEVGELVAWEWGPAGAPAVLLVHGWEGRGAQLAPFAAPLVAAGCRVVTFDAPAHGESPGQISSIVAFAGAIEQVTAAVGPLEAIVAHSMGGAATLWAGRERSVAKRLVLIAPPKDVRDFTRTLSEAFGLPPGMQERINRRLARRFGIPVESFQAVEIASRGQGPLLVVHDDRDLQVPIACGEAIAAAWPGATLLRTSGRGHQRILRDSAVIAAVVRFVSGTASSIGGEV